MSLGDFPLGDVPLGEDAIVNEPDKPLARMRALYLDPKLRDFRRHSDGRYQDIHWVDAAFELALLTEFGKMSAAPDTGQTLRQIESPIGPDVPREVDERARRAVQHLVDRGVARVISVRHHAPHRHALFVAVHYQNLLTNEPGLVPIG